MLEKQLQKLTQHYSGLVEKNRTKFGITLAGPLAFRATFSDIEISDIFEVEMFISHQYPNEHPVVWETNRRISKDFGHINSDGTLCIALPLDINKVLTNNPSLIGFIDNLLVPYLYSYCYWEKYKKMPFGERGHGAQGYLEYYLELFNTKDVYEVLSGIIGLLKNGYKPHEKCPCGSQKKTLRCHFIEAKRIANLINKKQIIYEIKQIAYYLERIEESIFPL